VSPQILVADGSSKTGLRWKEEANTELLNAEFKVSGTVELNATEMGWNKCVVKDGTIDKASATCSYLPSSSCPPFIMYLYACTRTCLHVRVSVCAYDVGL
jgi:hypothetical protein